MMLRHFFTTSLVWALTALSYKLPPALSFRAAFVAPYPTQVRQSASYRPPRFPNHHKPDDTGFRSALHLFGFGGDKTKSSDDLASYPKLASSDQKYESLSEYIRSWSELLESGGIRLTTPGKVEVVTAVEPQDDVVSSQGVQIIFQKTDTGYKSKEEEEAMERGEEEEKPKKKKGVKEGGVEILVEKLATDEVRVRVRRCNMDEDTVIKEMSEETILEELKKAIDVWKKEQS